MLKTVAGVEMVRGTSLTGEIGWTPLRRSLPVDGKDAKWKVEIDARGGTSLSSARSQARARGFFARLKKLEARRLGST